MLGRRSVRAPPVGAARELEALELELLAEWVRAAQGRMEGPGLLAEQVQV